jgi:hypothetical protein
MIAAPSQMHVSQHYTDLLARAVANSQLEHSLALMATHIGRRATQWIVSRDFEGHSRDGITRFGGPLKGTDLRDFVLHVIMNIDSKSRYLWSALRIRIWYPVPF